MERVWIGGAIDASGDNLPFALRPFRGQALPAWLFDTNLMIEEPGVSLIAGLEDCMGRPTRERPTLLRVANEALATPIRARFPDLPIEIAPTPELQEMFDEKNSIVPTKADAVAWFDELIQRLEQAAPWKHIDESRPLELRSAAAGISAGYLMVLGHGTKTRGFVVFRDAASYRSFLAHSHDPSKPVLGRPVFCQVEVGAPHVFVEGQRGQTEPPSEDDVALIASAAHAVCELDAKAIGQGRMVEVDTGGVHLLTRAAALPMPQLAKAAPKPERNAPCWCGSGKKYKKCHLPLE